MWVIRNRPIRERDSLQEIKTHICPMVFAFVKLQNNRDSASRAIAKSYWQFGKYEASTPSAKELHGPTFWAAFVFPSDDDVADDADAGVNDRSLSGVDWTTFRGRGSGGQTSSCRWSRLILLKPLTSINILKYMICRQMHDVMPFFRAWIFGSVHSLFFAISIAGIQTLWVALM